jgi:hypothetical protein
MRYERQIDCGVCGREFAQSRSYSDVEFPDEIDPPDLHEEMPVCFVCSQWSNRRRAGFVEAGKRWKPT